MTDLNHLVDRIDGLIDRLEEIMPRRPQQPNWENATAFRWRGNNHPAPLQAVRHQSSPRLQDILSSDRQKSQLDRNTQQFLQGQPANNALLWGSRGTGKSSLIKALLREYSDQGLRLIEIHKDQLFELPDLLDTLDGRSEKFILYSDDLSFEANDPSYKTLKAVLDGSICPLPENALIYATSNRRHLMPELNSENQETRLVNTELHHGEAVEEKVSLSDRFGLWLSFHPFNQDQYLGIVRHWIVKLNGPVEPWDVIRAEALRWALNRGSRSGRTAWQFARDWVGKSHII